jgi:hypothetical protein
MDEGDADLVAIAGGDSTDEPAAWIAGEARRRQQRDRGRRNALVAFEAGQYPPSALARARRLWTVRATAEHESVFVFAGLLPFALGANAGLDTEQVLLGMAEDEMRHAQICAEVARTLGGEPTPSEAPVIRRTGRPVEEQLLGHVIYGNCMTETVNAARLVDCSQTARDPFMKGALLSLLGDEVRHAKFGFALLAAWRPWLETHPDALRALDEALPRSFAALEARLSGVGARRDDFGEHDLALGNPDPARLAEVFYATVEGAVIPGLDRLGLRASAAWRSRPGRRETDASGTPMA